MIKEVVRNVGRLKVELVAEAAANVGLVIWPGKAVEVGGFVP
jgi:hypothetical protein